MKRSICLVLLLTAVLDAPAQQIDLLESSWENVIEVAAESKRHILVAFLGEDWSVASERFRSNIFESTAFREFADERLVFCPVDAHRMASRAKTRAAKLQSLVIHFEIKAYPTIILLAPTGEELLRHGFRDDSPERYTALLEAILPQPPAARNQSSE